MTEAPAPRISVYRALEQLFLHPQHNLIGMWNWKAALFSVAFRAPLFFSASLGGGLREAFGAMVAESVFRAGIAGAYAACTQALRRAYPAWLAGLTISVLLPASAHALEFLVHWLRGTHNLATGMVSSVLFTIVSTLFNWYAMRHGAFLMGEGSKSLASDLMAVPRIVVGFVLFIPLSLRRLARGPAA